MIRQVDENLIRNKLAVLKDIKVPRFKFDQEKEKIFNLINTQLALGPVVFKPKNLLVRFLALSLGTILIFIVAFGVFAASQQSLPSSPLYSFKILSEKVSIALAATPNSRVKARLVTISHRLHELKLNNNQSGNEIKQAVSGLNQASRDLDDELQEKNKYDVTFLKRIFSAISDYQSDVDFLTVQLPQYSAKLVKTNNYLADTQIKIDSIINNNNSLKNEK